MKVTFGTICGVVVTGGVVGVVGLVGVVGVVGFAVLFPGWFSSVEKLPSSAPLLALSLNETSEQLLKNTSGINKARRLSLLFIPDRQSIPYAGRDAIIFRELSK